MLPGGWKLQAALKKVHVLREDGRWKNQVSEQQDKERIQDKTALYMSDYILCLCVDLQALLGPIYWADNQNHAETTLWPQE